MSKQQVNVRVSQASREKLDWLTQIHGTQAEAVAVAIHDLYIREQQKEMVSLKLKAYAEARGDDYDTFARFVDENLARERYGSDEVRRAWNTAQEGRKGCEADG